MSVAHPLAGVVEKLRNADFHLERLANETKAYLTSDVNASILSEFDSIDHTRGVLKFHVLRQPSLKMAAIVGDVVHNLRCSLDYIVEELIKSNGNQPTTQNQFPICSDAPAFDKAIQNGRLKGVSERAIKAVEMFQPYHHVHPDGRRKHPLKWLHLLSNRDKHRVLAVNALNADLRWKFVTKDARIVMQGESGVAARHGDVLANIPVEFVVGGEKVQLQSKLTIQVGFDDPVFDNFDVTGALQTIREHIGMFIVPAFATLFAPLPAELKLTTHGLTAPSPQLDMLLLARPKQRSNQKE